MRANLLRNNGLLSCYGIKMMDFIYVSLENATENGITRILSASSEERSRVDLFPALSQTNNSCSRNY